MSEWSDGFLHDMHRLGDPPADETVEALFREGAVPAVNAALEHLSGNDSALPDGLPPALKRYLESSGTLPPTADAARIRNAQEFFTRNGPAFGVSLMYSSLPALYAGAQGGVQVLSLTGQLSQHYRRRAAETLRFILDVMSPGGLAPGGRGLRTAQKVRLLHAVIRRFARQTGRWSAQPGWGEPINQEELAGTLVSFSTLAADNAARLGVPVDTQAQEDYLHAWHCIGHVMGIVPEIRPTSVASARALWKRIAARNFDRTDDGVRLTGDHLAFLDEMVPGKALDGVNGALMRFLMGRDVASRCLGLSRAGWRIVFIDFLRALIGWSEKFLEFPGPVDKLVTDINLKMMEALQRQWAGNDGPPFRLPTTLG